MSMITLKKYVAIQWLEVANPNVLMFDVTTPDKVNITGAGVFRLSTRKTSYIMKNLVPRISYVILKNVLCL